MHGVVIERLESPAAAQATGPWQPPQLAVMVLNASIFPAVINIHSLPIVWNGLWLSRAGGISMNVAMVCLSDA